MNDFKKRRQLFLQICRENNLEDNVFNWTLWKRFWAQEKNEENVVKRFLQWKRIAG